jgi:predicted AlkP superfamily phosphohydrolase/phosphomutase
MIIFKIFIPYSKYFKNYSFSGTMIQKGRAMTNKIIVIGLDGATFDIIDPLITRGKLPNIKKIFSEGVRSKLFSSVPPISAPAWVSFMTGKNPAKHGVLGFQTYNLSKYACYDHSIVTSNSYPKYTIMDILSKNDKRSIAFQIPLTYPVWKINGKMIAGYPTPDQTKAFCYPESFSEELGTLYEYKSDQIAAGSTQEKIDCYSNSLERISEKVEKLIRNEPFDLFIYVNNTTDWVQHKFWKHQYDIDQPEPYIDLFYEKLDTKIGNIINLMDDDTTLILMSDHGAGTRPTKFLNINHLLKEKGYLIPAQKKINLFTRTNKYWFEWIKEYFPIRYWSKANFSSKFREKIINTRVYKEQINWTETKAYRIPLAYPYTGININLKGRQQEGIVEPGSDFENIKNTLYTSLKEFADLHPDLIEKVYRQEEFYHGPYIDNTPDIIIEINHKYDSGSEIDHLITDIPPILLQTISGYHRPYGIFAAMGKNILKNKVIKDINIMDIAPTILYLLNLEIDSDMDGRIINNMFNPYYLENNPANYSQEIQSVSYLDGENTQVSSEEEEDMMNALYEMGYM